MSEASAPAALLPGVSVEVAASLRRHVVVADDGQTLAMASTTGGLWVSADAGDAWTCLSRDLPPVAVLRFEEGP